MIDKIDKVFIMSLLALLSSTKTVYPDPGFHSGEFQFPFEEVGVFSPIVQITFDPKKEKNFLALLHPFLSNSDAQAGTILIGSVNTSHFCGLSGIIGATKGESKMNK